MSDLLQMVKGFSIQPKCVLVLGARSEAILKWLFSLTTSQVVLVEPELAIFEKALLLNKENGEPDSVTILHGLPVTDSEQKTKAYFSSNIPGFSSVLQPNVIQSIRPALEYSVQELQTIQLRLLIQQYNISESEPCLLVSQLNGGEQQCLNGDILSAFTHLVIQSSLKPVFGESNPIKVLRRQLMDSGRDYFELGESIPPYYNLLAYKQANTDRALNYFGQRKEHRESSEALECKLNGLNSETKKLLEDQEKAKRQLKKARDRNEVEQKELAKELESVKRQMKLVCQQSDVKQKHLSEELQEARQQLKISNQQNEETQKQIVEEMKQANQQLLKERNEEQHWHQKNKAWAESLNAEKGDLIATNDELSARLSQLQETNESLSEELRNTKAQEKNLISSLEINAKQFLKMQLDIEELRNKYKVKVQSENELKALIGELHGKLQQAASFYHQLENQHPELLLGSDKID